MSLTIEKKSTNLMNEMKDLLKEIKTTKKLLKLNKLTPELTPEGNRLHEEYLTLTPEQQENWDLHGPNKPWDY
tara:strand:- start:379 stop:597 length:219 start_codon:yes stop_codon:yes gene_type:complete